MTKITINLEDDVFYYHQFHPYWHDSPDEPLEVGEQYKKKPRFVFDKKEGKYRVRKGTKRIMIPLPYFPAFILTDEEPVKAILRRFKEKHPELADIESAGEGRNLMSCSIPNDRIAIFGKRYDQL